VSGRARSDSLFLSRISFRKSSRKVMQQVTHPGTIKGNCRIQRVVRSACFRHHKKLMRLVGQFGVLLPPGERRLEPPHCNTKITVSVPLCSKCQVRIPHRKLIDRPFVSLAETMSDSPPVHLPYRLATMSDSPPLHLPYRLATMSDSPPLHLPYRLATMSDSPPVQLPYPLAAMSDSPPVHLPYRLATKQNPQLRFSC